MSLISRFWPLNTLVHPSIACDSTAKDGLPNLGNTCWFNSLIQTVFRSEGPFKKALLFRAQNSEDSSTYPDTYSYRAIQLMSIIEQDNRDPLNQHALRKFIDEFKKHKFKSSHFGTQEDATEALSALFDYLNLDPLLDRVFPKNHVSVSEIDYHHINQENLSYNIVLPNLNVDSVQKALDHYFNCSEYILKTPESGLEVNHQTYSFTKTPYLSSEKADFKELIITLPRFLQNNYGHKSKNTNPIQVDDIITLHLCNDELIFKKKVTMRLKSVSIHTGGLHGGHYTAYVRNPNGTFDYFNDSIKNETISYDQAKLDMEKNGYFAVYEVIETQDIHQDNQSHSLAQVHPITTQTTIPEDGDGNEDFVDAFEVLPMEEPDVFEDALEEQPKKKSVTFAVPDESLPTNSSSPQTSSPVSQTASKTVSIWSKFLNFLKPSLSSSHLPKVRFWSNWFKSKSSSFFTASTTSSTVATKTQSVWSKILDWWNSWHSKSEC